MAPCEQPERSACPIAKTLDLLGDRWTLLVVRDLLFFGKRRFGELASSPEGIPTNILSDRLRRLEECGVVVKVPYATRPQRYEYHLTDRGNDLTPVLRAMIKWAQTHLPGTAMAPPPELMVRATAAAAAALQPEVSAAPDQHEPACKQVRVLFLCTHNSARSQMAEGILRYLAGDTVEVASAGTEVTRVHPLAIRAMEARGIDLRGQRSKHLDEFLGQPLDYVITVCDNASETCPFFPGAPQRLHWSIPDPSRAQGDEKARQAAFQRAADDLLTRIRDLLPLLQRRVTLVASLAATAAVPD